MQTRYLFIFILVLTLSGWLPSAEAAVRTFNLEATYGYISTPDGGQTYIWGFAEGGRIQYPGPVLDVNEGDEVIVNLINNLPDTDGSGPLKADPVSLLFSGQEGVSNQEPVYEVTGDKASLRSFAEEAAPDGGSVTYRFIAGRPGTFYYQSGTYPHKHIDMGLIGGLIIRPAGYNPDLNKRAYSTDDSV